MLKPGSWTGQCPPDMQLVCEAYSWSSLEKLGSRPGLLNAGDYTGLCHVRREGSWLSIWTHPTRKEGCVARCPSLLRHTAVTLGVHRCLVSNTFCSITSL